MITITIMINKATAKMITSANVIMTIIRDEREYDDVCVEMESMYA